MKPLKPTGRHPFPDSHRAKQRSLRSVHARAGEVIATDTPAGVGGARQPFPEGLLKVGEVVRIEIDGIG